MTGLGQENRLATTRAQADCQATLLVFSDLDGTLLDHHSYSSAGARTALARLQQLAIPLILVSSKTRAEIEALQQRLKIDYPFVCENGGGIVFPPRYDSLILPQGEKVDHGRLVRLGQSYAKVRRFFISVQHHFELKGFGDMGCEEIVARTGLSVAEAERARQREFSEPFLFLGKAQPEELAVEAAKAGLALTRGGRFYHLMGAAQDKGRAVAAVVEIFAANGCSHLRTIGLGDSANDLPLLAAVDIPVLIPHQDGGFETIELPGLRRAPAPGSKGWGAIMTLILDEINST